MDILLLLIPLSLVLVALIGGVFVWSVKSGQYDDLEGPAHRILADDDSPAVLPPVPGGVDEAGRDGASLTSIKPGGGAAS